jgi:hypothetical protein
VRRHVRSAKLRTLQRRMHVTVAEWTPLAAVPRAGQGGPLRAGIHTRPPCPQRRRSCSFAEPTAAFTLGPGLRRDRNGSQESHRSVRTCHREGHHIVAAIRRNGNAPLGTDMLGTWRRSHRRIRVHSSPVRIPQPEAPHTLLDRRTRTHSRCRENILCLRPTEEAVQHCLQRCTPAAGTRPREHGECLVACCVSVLIATRGVPAGSP